MARRPRNLKLTAHDVRSASHVVPKNYNKTKRLVRKNELRSTSEEKDLKNATGSICLERPHDAAALLLCSSSFHNKGCRPYMCGTNYKHSNCLELFKNAYSREKSACEVSTAVEPTNQRLKTMLLACPICRGEVKGWTVVNLLSDFWTAKGELACMRIAHLSERIRDSKKKTCEVQASVIKNLVKLTLHAWLNGKSLKMKRRGKMRLALSVLWIQDLLSWGTTSLIYISDSYSDDSI